MNLVGSTTTDVRGGNHGKIEFGRHTQNDFATPQDATFVTVNYFFYLKQKHSCCSGYKYVCVHMHKDLCVCAHVFGVSGRY